jgi:alanine racemase
LRTTSTIELSQSALVNNIDFIRTQIGSDVRISSVVKGNAYGHGIIQFVPMAEKAGIDHFSAFSANEASAVKESAENNPDIMIMGWLDNAELEWAIKSGISFWIFEPERLDHAIAISKRLKQKAKIHLEVETGMNRTGLDDTELEYVIMKVLDNGSYIELEGICTHFAGAESITNFVRVHRQISRFNKIYKKVTRLGLHPKIRHTASSAAAMSYPRTRMDMVRIGIMQYGFWPSIESLVQYLHGESFNHDPLNRVIP